MPSRLIGSHQDEFRVVWYESMYGSKKFKLERRGWHFTEVFGFPAWGWYKIEDWYSREELGETWGCAAQYDRAVEAAKDYLTQRHTKPSKPKASRFTATTCLYAGPHHVQVHAANH